MLIFHKLTQTMKNKNEHQNVKLYLFFHIEYNAAFVEVNSSKYSNRWIELIKF